MLDKATQSKASPFDATQLDRLMDEAGLDVLMATSKHNVQYLLGGHRSFFFDNMDAIGTDRYLPAFVYPKGAPDKAAYFGHGMETYQTQIKPLWVPKVNTKSGGSVDVMQKAADYARSLVKKGGRIGVELAFIPANSEATLRKTLPDGNQGCVVRARALARAQDAGGAGEATDGVRTRYRFHARGDR
jgi:Xaa-Pro aminopeptidase